MSKLLYTHDDTERYRLAVEQLEVCAELISSESPHKARMAIILLDNLADILLLRYCNYKFSEDFYFGLVYDKPKYTRDQLKKAQDNLHGKLEMVRNNTKVILTKKDETIISVCHAYRNSAQHNDEHNPQMTIAIAKILFTTVGNLFVRIQHSRNSVYYASSVAKWLQKYTTKTHLVYKDFAQEIVKKFQKGISLSLPNLKKTILFDLSSRIEKIEEIIREIPLRKSKDFSHMLKMFEYERSEEYRAFGANMYDAKYRMESNSITYHDGFLKSVAKEKDEILRQSYKPNVTYQTYLKIKKNYQNISKEKKLESTLKAYERFSRPLEKLELLFEDAFRQWDEWQQLMLDIARGK